MAHRIASFLTAATAFSGCATTDPRENVSQSLETPAFVVTDADGAFEVRRYARLITAQTIVEGDREQATREGFRRLAGYIFGRNKARARVAMTAPVSAAPAREVIAMTAPVAARPVGGTDVDARWAVTFTMPSAYSLDTLPVPDDARVTLEAAPPRERAAVVFAGTTSAAAVDAKTRELEAWIAARGLIATSAPELARYNDPWTLPWNRRNEVIIDVAAAEPRDGAVRIAARAIRRVGDRAPHDVE